MTSLLTISKTYEPALQQSAKTDSRSGTMPAVLFVLPWLPGHPGGVNTVVRALCDECDKEGDMRPFVLVNDWTALAPELAALDGYRIVKFRIPPVPGQMNAWGWLKYFLWFVFFGSRCLFLLRRLKVTGINIHYPGSATAFFFVLARKCRLFDGAVVLSYHGLDLEDACNLEGFDNTVYRWALRGADNLTACSNALCRRLEAGFPEGMGKTLCIHNGTDVSAPVSANEVVRRTVKPVRTILNVGTFEQKKGQDVLLRAYARIAQSAQIRLFMVGRTGTFLPYLRQLAGDLGLSERVEFVCDLEHKQMKAYYEAADMFISASRIEPFGIAILEAGAAGVPVVATATGGVIEFLSDEVNALLVPPDDVAALATKIDLMIERADMRRELALRLLEDVQVKFQWSTVWQQYRSLFVDPAGRKPLQGGWQ